jgi:hypothetical protein
LYDRFANWAAKRGLKAVVVFIPYEAKDLTSGLRGIAAATEDQRRQIIFVNIDRDIDKDRYTVGPGCHPSPVGNRMIAENIAMAIDQFVNSSSLRR